MMHGARFAVLAYLVARHLEYRGKVALRDLDPIASQEFKKGGTSIW